MQISGGKYDRDDYMLQSAEVAGGEGRGGLVVHNNSDEDDEEVSWQGNIDARSRGRKS